MNTINLLHLHLRDWSPESLTVEAHFDAHNSNATLPKPGEFIQAIGPTGQVFYLLVDTVHATHLDAPNGLLLKTTPIKGHPEFPVHQARTLSGPAYLSTLLPSHEQTPSFEVTPHVHLALNLLGDWLFMSATAHKALEALIDAEIAREHAVLEVIDANALSASHPVQTTHQVVLGQDCFLSLNLIRSDRLIEALIADLPSSLQDPCSRFLHEQFATLSDHATFDDLFSQNAEAWASFSFGRPLKEKIAALRPYFEGTDSDDDATRKKTKTKRKTTKNPEQGFKIATGATVTQLVLPNLPEDLQRIIYMGSIGLLRMPFSEGPAQNCRIILHHPEWEPSTVRHFLGMTAHPVVLVSSETEPWLTLVDDAILTDQKHPEMLWLWGHLTGGVKIPLQGPSVNLTESAMSLVAMPTVPQVPEFDTVLENPFLPDTTTPESVFIHENQDPSETETPLQVSNALDEETVIDDWSLQDLVNTADLTLPADNDADNDSELLLAHHEEEPELGGTSWVENTITFENDWQADTTHDMLSALQEAALSPEETATSSQQFFEPPVDSSSSLDAAPETHPDMSLEPFEFEALGSSGLSDSEHNTAQWLSFDSPDTEASTPAALESVEPDSQDWLTLDPTETLELTLDDVNHEQGPQPEDSKGNTIQNVEQSLDMSALQQDLNALESTLANVSAEGFDMGMALNNDFSDEPVSESGLLEAAALASDFELPSLAFDMNSEAGLAIDAGPLLADEPAPLSLEETLAMANTSSELSDTNDNMASSALKEAGSGLSELSELSELSDLLSASFEMPEAHQEDVVNTAEHLVDVDVNVDMSTTQGPTPQDDFDTDALALGDLDNFGNLGDLMSQFTDTTLSDAEAVGQEATHWDNNSPSLQEGPPDISEDSYKQHSHSTPTQNDHDDSDELGSLDFGDLDSLLAETEGGSEEFITPDWDKTTARAQAVSDPSQPLPVIKSTSKPPIKQAYQPGQRVTHPNYGDGVVKKVMQMYDDQIVLNIQFDAVGKRLLDPSLCELKSLSTAP